MHGISYSQFLTLEVYAVKTCATTVFLLILGTITVHEVRHWLKKLVIGAGRHED